MGLKMVTIFFRLVYFSKDMKHVITTRLLAKLNPRGPSQFPHEILEIIEYTIQSIHD